MYFLVIVWQYLWKLMGVKKLLIKKQLNNFVDKNNHRIDHRLWRQVVRLNGLCLTFQIEELLFNE